MARSTSQQNQPSHMRVLGVDGDSGIAWDPADAASKALAREFFAAHAGSLYLAFQDEQGIGQRIPYGGFDPAVHDNVVLVPIPVVG